MDDDSISTERRLSAIERQLHENIAMRGKQEQEFAQLLTARMAEVLDEFRALMLKEQDERAKREFNRYTELQQQIDARFDAFGGEIDVIRDTHGLTQGLGNDIQQLVQEVQTLRGSQDTLSSEFHEYATATGERLTNVEATIVEHSAAIESFYKSRDESRELHREAKQERAELAGQVEALSAEIKQVLSLVGGVLDFGFIEAFPDAIIVIEYSGVIVRVNSKTEQLFGWHRAELIGQPIEVLIPEALRGAHIAHRMAYAEAPEPRRMGHSRPGGARAFPAIRADGAPFQVEVGLGSILLGGRPHIIATVREAGDGK